jgi:hypothetical protein
MAAGVVVKPTESADPASGRSQRTVSNYGSCNCMSPRVAVHNAPDIGADRSDFERRAFGF